MDYLLILIAALLFSSQFMFSEGCQRENGYGWSVAVKLSFYGALIGIPVILVMNILMKRASFEFSWFSFAVALVYALLILVLKYCTIRTFAYANLSVYTVFSMIGGMALPFLYGVLRGEELRPVKVICFALILLSILLMYDKGKSSKKAFFFCMAVFVLNGMSGVISAYHQSKTALCVGSGSFMIMTKVITAALCLPLILFRTKDVKVNGKTVAYTVGESGFNSIGNLFLLIALLNLPASVQYPMLTGGTIVFSTLIDLIRKEPVTKKELIAAGISFAASCLMAV